MLLPSLKNAELKEKKVFLRCDLDAPMSEVRSIEDDTRLLANLPTIEYLLEHGADVILAGHLGRPEGIDKSLTLEPVAEWLYQRIRSQESGIKYEKLARFWGWRIADKVFLLENLRFYEEEAKNDPKFAKELAALADIYVNEAFATCHRNHASIVGVPRFLPHFAGLRLQQEIEVLSGVLQNPKRPLVVIVGGEKIETKLPVVAKMHQIADYILVGGKIAQHQKELLVEQHKTVADRKSVLLVADLNPKRTDITMESRENFLQIIALAKTVAWNGPVGKIDQISKIKDQKQEDSAEGTRRIAEGIAKSAAFKIVGGGDTVGFLKKLNLLEKFDFVSMGGGAMLTFLAGEKLPGIEALLSQNSP